MFSKNGKRWPRVLFLTHTNSCNKPFLMFTSTWKWKHHLLHNHPARQLALHDLRSNVCSNNYVEKIVCVCKRRAMMDADNEKRATVRATRINCQPTDTKYLILSAAVICSLVFVYYSIIFGLGWFKRRKVEVEMGERSLSLYVVLSNTI